MNHQIRALRALVLAGSLAWAGAASASPIVDHSAGMIIRSNIQVSFQSLVDFAEDPQVLLGNPVAGGSDVLPSTASVSPTLGDGTATGTVTFQFDYGAGLEDSFAFSGDATLSALSAINFEGLPAGAEALAFGSAAFFLPIGFANHPITGLPTVLDDLIGSLIVAPTGDLQAFEITRTVEVRRDTAGANVLEALVGPGDPAATVNLLVGHQYNVNVLYRASVPFGTDPDFSFSLGGGTVLAIPEPSSIVLAVFALIGLAAFGWRRRKSIHHCGLCVGLAGLLWSLALPGPACASLIATAAPNGIRLTADLLLGFEGATVTDSFAPPTSTKIVNPEFGPSDSVDTPLFIRFPTTGDAKDKAEGKMTVQVDFGPPVMGATVPQDTITFTAHAVASAVNAKNSIGEESSAFVSAIGEASFFLDAGFAALPPDALTGIFTLANTFVLDPFETGEIRVLIDNVLVSTTPLGSGDVIVPLLTDHLYTFQVRDGLKVPFGIDPVLDRTFDSALTVIPEPSTLALAVFGLVGLAAFGLRRQRR